MAIEIHVKLNGILAASLGFKERNLQVPEKTRIEEVLELMQIPVKTNWILVSVNGVVQRRTCVLKNGDVLLIAPVGGGG